MGDGFRTATQLPSNGRQRRHRDDGDTGRRPSPSPLRRHVGAFRVAVAGVAACGGRPRILRRHYLCRGSSGAALEETADATGAVVGRLRSEAEGWADVLRASDRDMRWMMKRITVGVQVRVEA